MSDFRIELAGQADEAAIRQLLAAHPLPGNISVSFQREPDYFAGCATMGREHQVLIARAGHNGNSELAGIACRAVRNVFVNGREERLGYLGQLRVAAHQRGRWLVSRGYRFLQQLHEADPVPAYLLSIIEGNVEATGVLVNRRRKHFPEVREIGRLMTLALPLGKTKPPLHCKAEIARAQVAELREIVAFLRRQGARRQFYPAWNEADFSGDSTTRAFKLEDFFIAKRNGEIVGVIGLWDQSSYKQTVVRAYGGWLRAARPLYNTVAPLVGRPHLPRVGEEIRYAYAAFVCIADDEPDVFDALLRAVYNLAVARGHAYLMIGLEARDPLLPAARAYSHIAYPSRLYLAFWEGGDDFYARLNERTLWVEIATL
jgi:hypothetical protein